VSRTDLQAALYFQPGSRPFIGPSDKTGSRGRFTDCPALNFAQHPRGGTGTKKRAQIGVSSGFFRAPPHFHAAVAYPFDESYQTTYSS
jgi:hypothetical protein